MGGKISPKYEQKKYNAFKLNLSIEEVSDHLAEWEFLSRQIFKPE